MSRIDSDTLRHFVANHAPVAVADIVAAKGSTPRAAGAWMLIAPDANLGTIGGGVLEQQAIGMARALLTEGGGERLYEQVLGPESGQCCGGRSTVRLRVLTEKLATLLEAQTETAEARWPALLLFGAGHVGRALARALAPLPVRLSIYDPRPEMIADFAVDGGPSPLLLTDPEQTVRAAPPGSAFVVMTHDHALDFRLVGTALRRGDAAYVGMIGSKAKRARLASRFQGAGGSAAQLSRLFCPIGGKLVVDKRPEVIAAMATAEILTCLSDLPAKES